MAGNLLQTTPDPPLLKLHLRRITLARAQMQPDALRIKSIPAQLRRAGRQLFRGALAVQQAEQGLQAQALEKRGDAWQTRGEDKKFRLDFFWKIGKVADAADALRQNAAKELQRLPDRLLLRPFQPAMPCTTR